MKNGYANKDYIEIIEDPKKQLIEKRKELNDEDQEFSHNQAIIDSHWDK